MHDAHGRWSVLVAALIPAGFVSAQQEPEEVAVVPGVSLVSRGQTGWRYLDTGEAPAKGWTCADFDDSRWREGRAPLGYGEDDVATLLGYGGDGGRKFPVAFFRLDFKVETTAEAYAARIRADDGAVIYLNGKEIHRLRVPPGEIDYTAYSSAVLATGTAGESDLVLFPVDPAAVVRGENVLCVSVHQSSGQSSDLVLDMELLGVSKQDLAGIEERERAVRTTRERQRILRGRNEEEAGGARLAAHVKEQWGSLLPLLGESVGRRYDLDEAEVEKLRDSMRESIDSMLQQPEAARAIGTRVRVAAGEYGSGLVETLLSQDGTRAALADHLGKERLRDYLEFSGARAQRDQQAVDRGLIVWLDGHLSLTAEQGRTIERLMAGETGDARSANAPSTNALRAAERATDGWRPSAMDMLSMDRDDQEYQVGQRLAARMEELLTANQSEVWKLLGTSQDTRNRRRQGAGGDDRDDEDGEVGFERAEVQLAEAVAAGRVTREQAAARLEGLKRRLGSEDEPEYVGIRAAQERTRKLVTAMLAAHTEQLGALDARAARRLALVARGVAEQYLESGAAGRPGDREADIRNAAGVPKPGGALARQRTGERRPGGPGARVTDHPLYQGQIEQVLSEEAYARYRARRSERVARREQAQRDLVVASMDTFLLLGEKQRQQLAGTVAKLSVPPSIDEAPAAGRLFASFLGRFDPSMLGRSQRARFRRIAQQAREWFEEDDEVDEDDEDDENDEGERVRRRRARRE